MSERVYRKWRERMLADRERQEKFPAYEYVEKEEPMTVLAQVQSFDADRADVHEMIDLVTRARQVKGTYEEARLPVPEALVDGIRRLDTGIESHRKDVLEKRMKEIKAARTGLMSQEEKKAALDREQAEIEAALGIVKA